MSDWTAGYVADIGYTFGYYTELNPQRVKLAFLNAGLVAPDVGTACELGFGQGVSTNIHAAASVVQWHGTDFMPAHAAFAQELAAIAGAGADLRDETFADFCTRVDLPDFDYIALHGIWSWISDANRRVLVDFFSRKLKVGGILYVSYNTQPGWSTLAPMQHLFAQHAKKLGMPGAGSVARINGAIDFADKLLATNPLYARVNPTVTERFKGVKSGNRSYLAHEFFNADWHPMYFADAADWLSAAKLSYACSANLLDHVDAVNLNAEQQALLKEVPTAELRETVRDFVVNQQFRKDYWVKGARQLSLLERAEALRTLRVVLITPRPNVSLKVNGAIGESTMNEAVYMPVLDALADHKPRTFEQLELLVKEKGVSFAQLLQSVVILAGTGQLQMAQDDVSIGKAQQASDKLNAHLLRKARSNADVCYLSSPVTGGGVAVGRFEQLFLLARSQANTSQADQPSDWARYAWSLLVAQGQKLVVEGNALETAAESLEELGSQAKAFAERRLPMLKALRIV